MKNYIVKFKISLSCRAKPRHERSRGRAGGCQCVLILPQRHGEHRENKTSKIKMKNYIVKFKISLSSSS